MQVESRWTAEDEDWRSIETGQRGLDSSPGALAQRVAAVLRAEERLLEAWSPIFLTRELDRWFWPQGMDTIAVKKLWEENLCRYTYFPRLLSRDVLAGAITEGATRTDYFGYADGVLDGSRYVGLCLGRRPGQVLFDGESVLVRREVALAAIEKPPVVVPPGNDDTDDGDGGSADTGGEGTQPPKPPVRRPTHFYGAVKLNPLRLGTSASQIGEEIVRHLTALAGGEVNVTLQIEARAPEGVPEATERTVSENARQLKFQTFEFEGD